MSKQDIIYELNILEADILTLSYVEDWDGDDPEGKPIIRQVYTPMEEKDLRYILNKITEIVQKIKESE